MAENKENIEAALPDPVGKETTKVNQTAITETDVKKSGYDFTYKTAAVNLHYDALLPNGKINAEHVNKVLGYKVKTKEERGAIANQWAAWKKEVRGWATYHVRETIKKAASQLEDEDTKVKPTLNGKPIENFDDVQQWWKLSNPTCIKTEATYAHLAYDMWKTGWEKQWEKDFMTTNGWSYDEKVMTNIQNTCGRKGYNMKGCVAKNIKQVKGQIVKEMGKQGENCHGKMVKKRRDNSEAYTEDNKYIRSKKVTIRITPKETVDLDKKPYAKTKRDAKKKKETVDLDKKASAKTTKDEKKPVQVSPEVVTEYNEGDVTVIEIEGDMIDAARSPEEPEYQPSAYELEVAARRKKIEDYFNEKYPKTTEQKKPPKKRQEKVSFIMLSLDYLILLLTYFTLFFTARQSGRCYTNKKNEEINCPPNRKNECLH